MDVDGALESNGGLRLLKLGTNWVMLLSPGISVSFAKSDWHRVVLEATAIQTLNEVPMEDLEKFSIEDGAVTELFPFSSR